MIHSIVAPPLDHSLNWPRDLRAAMFALAGEIERMNADIRETSYLIESCCRRRHRMRHERLVDRWVAQRGKLRRFFDQLVFADIRARP